MNHGSAGPLCFGEKKLSFKILSCTACAAALFTLFAFGHADAQVNVTGAVSGNGSYTTLRAAFNAINGGVQTGTNINIIITGNTNESTNSAVLFEGAWNSLLIQPSGGLKIISGNTNPGSPLIDLNGADKVTINGLNVLTITNTTASSVTGTGTIRFAGDASNNSITGCKILGAAAVPFGSAGGTIYFAGGFTTGNDNNIISSCEIGPSSGSPTMAVHYRGLASVDNSNNQITFCLIYDYFNASSSSAGIYVQEGTIELTLNGNRFYQTSPKTQTTGSLHSAIYINNPAGNDYSVLQNIIGYSNAGGTGIYTLNGTTGSTFDCIRLNVGSADSSIIQGNVIAGISMSGSQSGTHTSAPFKGINIESGLVKIGTTLSNTIGSMSSTGSITYSSVSASASGVIGMLLRGSSDFIVRQNNIGGITASNSSTGAANISCIRSESLGTLTCEDNTIGGTVANSIRSTSTSTSTIVNGIENSGVSAVISSNLIRNLTAASGTAASGYLSPTAGIVCNVFNFTQTISQNIIHSITNSDNSNATVTSGIYLNSTATTNLIERNFIHSFSAAGAGGSIIGIYSNGGSADYQNNMIRLGIDASGNDVTSCIIKGINETAGTNNFQFNSIYVGGTATAGSSNTFSFISSVTVNTRRYRNNIFFNARSNSGGSGKHYAISVGGTSPLPAGLISNYNDLFVNGNGSVLGLYNSIDRPDLASWQTATGRDANSISANPFFEEPDGNSSEVDLHIADSTFTPVESTGLLIGITNDYDDQTRSSLSPTDIGADAGNFTDQIAPSISYALLPNSGLDNVNFTNVTITDATGINGTAGTRPRCYYKKKTNTNTFNNNTNSTNGWKYVEATGPSSPFSFTINNSLLFGGISPGDTIQYFVIAQDLDPSPNVGINSGTFASVPSSVNLTAAAFPVGGSVNSYKLDVIAVTGAISGNGAYPDLASAFQAINGGSQSGANIIVSIFGNTTEPVTGAVLNNGSWTKLTIRPEGGLQRTITSAVNPGAALIHLNGADNVIIDGINSGGNSLILSNTTVSSTAGTCTIKFENSTNNSSVKRCSIFGSSTDKSNTANVLFGTSAPFGPGNNGNSISFCNIGPAGTNLPSCGVASVSSTYFNSNDTISNCNIYDYFNASGSSSGIYLNNFSEGFVIKDNKFYQTSLRTQVTGSSHSAMDIDYLGNVLTVTGNTIGFASSAGTGTYSFSGVTNSVFNGILVKCASDGPVTIQNNTIAGIAISGSMSGYCVQFINLFNYENGINTVSNNTVGSITTPGSITYTTTANAYNSIRAILAEGGNWTANNNTIGSISASATEPGASCQIVGIYSTSNINCNSNTIGGFLPNSLHSAMTGNLSEVNGIYATSANSISSNTISNLTSNGGNSDGGSRSQVTGISCSNSTLTQNFIFNLSYTNSSLPGSVSGIQVLGGQNLISKSLIHSLSSASTSSYVSGIECSDGISTVQNSMIRLGLDSAGNSLNTGCFYFGIFEENSIDSSNIYFNSVYIGGTATSGTSNSFAFRSTEQSSPRTYLNNIFTNFRTNSSGLVNHYAIGIDADVSMTSNNNILFAPNQGGMIALFNGSHPTIGSWRLETDQDNNSQAKDPLFLNPASGFFFGLQINPVTTPVEQNGVFIASVTDDFYGAPRAVLTPADIGAHAGNFTPVSPLAGDYIVGLSMFNSIAGTNIHFERKVNKVINDGIEAEEETFVPMQNGEIYTGQLYIKRNEHPEIPDAMTGIFANLNTALNELYSSGSNAPVRFLLNETTITDESMPFFIGKWQGASAINTLTIKPNTGVVCTISGNASAIFDINSAEYFTLDGSNINNGTSKDLTIANSSGSGSAVTFINDARFNAVRNCILKGSSVSTDKGVVSFLTTNGIHGNDSNLVQNNDITANTVLPDYCLYNSGSGVTSDQKNSNNMIIGNKIYDFATRGITDEGNSAATLYEGNEIFSISPMTSRGAGFRISGVTVEGFTFRNNYIHDLKTSGIPGNDWIFGIELAGIQTSFTGEIYNNFISLSHNTSVDMRGIADRTSGSSFNIYYNSINIYGLSNAGTNSSAYYRQFDAATNFMNNILVNTRSGGTNYAIRTSDALNNFNCDHNDIYASGGAGSYFGKVNTTNYANLSGWRNATNKDSNSVSADPHFVSNADLHIDSTQASSVSNKGIPVTGITTDFDNDNRSLTIPDIGADEYDSPFFPVNLDLTVLLEGFYDASTDTQISDTVTVYLKDQNSPFVNVDSARAFVAANGNCSPAFTNAPSGSYYIVLSHRNSIQTWSSVPVAVSNESTTSYNFTTASSQAFGNNMKQVDASPVRFAVYGGDVNRDRVVTLTDIIDIYNNSTTFTSGYVVTDVNGDGVVNLNDVTLAYNNSALFVQTIVP